jgi:thiol-disulfide isomerase/thioredoxin
MMRWRLALIALLLSPPAAVQAQPPAAPIRWSDIALLDGRTLEANRLDGKVVVQFWASWCPFCAKQNPHLQRLHERHGRDLQVLTFSIDAKAGDTP